MGSQVYPVPKPCVARPAGMGLDSLGFDIQITVERGATGNTGAPLTHRIHTAYRTMSRTWVQAVGCGLPGASLRLPPRLPPRPSPGPVTLA